MIIRFKIRWKKISFAQWWMHWKRNKQSLQLHYKIRYLSSCLRRWCCFQFFFSYSWNGYWNDWPLGPCDMNSSLKKLVRELIKTDHKCLSGWNCTVCEYKHCPFFHCGSARRASMKRNTSLVVGFIAVVLYNKSTTHHTAAARKISKACSKQLARNLSSRTD